MNVDLAKLIGHTAEYRRAEKWDTEVTIQGCYWPPGKELPQLIATDRVAGTFIVDTVTRFRAGPTTR